MNTHNLIHEADALERRFAARVAAGLSVQAASLPHDISERLRVAREQAVARARTARQAATAPVVVAAGHGAAVLASPTAWWQRLASVVPLAVLVAGMLLIHEWMVREQVQAAADIDAVLLADDLPPAAYTDPGFAEYLKTPQP